MTPLSMTGFGSASGTFNSTTLDVEIRTLNHRFLEVFVHLAPDLPREWEALCRKQIEKRLVRGRVDVYIEARTPPEESRVPRVDTSLAEAYHIALKELAETRHLPLVLDTLDLAKLPGVLELQEPQWDLARAESTFLETLDRAVAEVLSMRQSEGESLGEAVGSLLEAFREDVDIIEGRIPELERHRYQVILERVEALLERTETEVPDIVGEVALMAQRASISEELDRLKSHLEQIQDILQEEGPVGRRLDFLVGEMGRESNTIAAKIDDADLNRIALRMKAHLEDMKEQARNIE
ncbi:MAG: YicC/YloC family endoribonuclease [Bacillota bacterium]